jgi:molybdopterin/thiamine biosynthesis adenylyltransferase
LLPEPPPAEYAPNCAEAGVLGVLPGIVGSIQALEAIKLLLGVGEPLRGRLIVFDALELSFTEFKLRTDPDNQVTWENRHRVEVVELQGLCAPRLTP